MFISLMLTAKNVIVFRCQNVVLFDVKQRSVITCENNFP